MALCIAIDVFDLTVGRALFAVPWEEVVFTFPLVLMWGPAGLLYMAEISDFTEQIDAFIPTATLIGLLFGWRKVRSRKDA